MGGGGASGNHSIVVHDGIGNDGLRMAVLLTLGFLASQTRLDIGGKRRHPFRDGLRSSSSGFRITELDGMPLILATKGPYGHVGYDRSDWREGGWEGERTH